MSGAAWFLWAGAIFVMAVLTAQKMKRLKDGGRHLAEGDLSYQIDTCLLYTSGNIKDAAGGRLKVAHPEGVYGRFMEHSTGKDTTTGHWEIAGLYTPKPFKTYPDGFPQELMEEFTRQTGRGWLGNCTASGTEIIKELGEEHEKTGKVRCV